MLEAVLSGVAGAVLGVVLGGTGKYWALRRDAWTEARTSGLLLLADVRALLAAAETDAFVTRTRLGVVSWEAHRETLAGFRRGSFPNGFTAPEWLELAAHFAELELLADVHPSGGAGDWWAQARTSWTAAETLLARFEHDPRVARYVLTASFRR